MLNKVPTFKDQEEKREEMAAATHSTGNGGNRNLDAQRGFLQCYARAGKTPTEAYTLLVKAYGEKAFSKRQTFFWMKTFKEGRENICSESGHLPLTEPKKLRMPEMVDRVREIVEQDRRITLHELAEQMNVSHMTIQ